EHAANEDEKSEAKPTQPGTNFSITRGIWMVFVLWRRVRKGIVKFLDAFCKKIDDLVR
ncbi:MAG: hypothetical protein RL235_222, partial [Chlamydiota bacterium]